MEREGWVACVKNKGLANQMSLDCISSSVIRINDLINKPGVGRE